eukprot:1151279-Pelagomonas_calceolata.AAC.2
MQLRPALGHNLAAQLPLWGPPRGQAHKLWRPEGGETAGLPPQRLGTDSGPAQARCGPCHFCCARTQRQRVWQSVCVCVCVHVCVCFELGSAHVPVGTTGTPCVAYPQHSSIIRNTDQAAFVMTLRHVHLGTSNSNG